MANINMHDSVKNRKAVVDEASLQPLDSVCHATETELRRAVAERDAFEQEVFETDRFAACVSHERQNLIRRNEVLKAELAAVTEALDQHKRTIAAMYASTSWKFARPVRALKKLSDLIRKR